MKEVKIRFLLPLQGWCVKARGLHEHFSLFSLFQAMKLKNRYNKQRTKCFCPKCDNELCGSNSYQCFRVTEKGSFEFYKCSKCGEKSFWDFDKFPIPVLVEEIH